MGQLVILYGTVSKLTFQYVPSIKKLWTFLTTVAMYFSMTL